MTPYIVVVLMVLPKPELDPAKVPYQLQAPGSYEVVVPSIPPFEKSLDCQAMAREINKKQTGKPLNSTTKGKIAGAWCNVAMPEKTK